jgi:hypothetical protein
MFMFAWYNCVMKHSSAFWATYKYCYMLQKLSLTWPRKKKFRGREEYTTEKFQRCVSERTWSRDPLSYVAVSMVAAGPKKTDSVKKDIQRVSPVMAYRYPYPLVASCGCFLGYIMLIAMRDIADLVAILFPF